MIILKSAHRNPSNKVLAIILGISALFMLSPLLFNIATANAAPKTTGGSATPVNQQASQIDTDNFYSCAVTTSQYVFCAGKNANGQLGDGTVINRSTPVQFQLKSGLTATAVNAGENHICVLATDSQAYCAGLNSSGQLGDGTVSNRSNPIKFRLPAGKSAISLSVTSNNTCVVTSDQLTYCAGLNSSGQLGDGTTSNRSTPVKYQLPAGMLASVINVSNNHICTVTTNQLVYCSGKNTSGQLGDGTFTNRSVPTQYQLPAGALASAMNVTSDDHTCVLVNTDQAYCAGLNTSGQLGDGTLTNKSTPVLFQLPIGKTAIAVNTNSGFICAQTTDQLAYCSGANNLGQLGDGTTSNRSVPVQFQLPVGKLITSMVLTSHYTCIITSDSTAYCSGQNTSGQLGDGTFTNRSVPTQFQLPPGKAATAVNTAFSHTCVLTADQNVYCVGANTTGQLGDGTLINRSIPVQFILP